MYGIAPYQAIVDTVEQNSGFSVRLCHVVVSAAPNPD